MSWTILTNHPFVKRCDLLGVLAQECGDKAVLSVHLPPDTLSRACICLDGVIAAGFTGVACDWRENTVPSLEAVCGATALLGFLGYRDMQVMWREVIRAHVRTADDVHMVLRAARELGPHGTVAITFAESAAPPGDKVTAWPAPQDELEIVTGADVNWLASNAEALAVASWPVAVFWAAPAWDPVEFLGPVYSKAISLDAYPAHTPAVIAGGYPAALARARLARGLPVAAKTEPPPPPVLSPHGDVDVFLGVRSDEPREESGGWFGVSYMAHVLGLDSKTVKVLDETEADHVMFTLFAPELPRPVQVVLHPSVVDVFGFVLEFDLAHCQAAVSAATGVVFSAVALAAWVSNTTWITTPRLPGQTPHFKSLVRLAVTQDVLKYNVPSRDTAAILSCDENHDVLELGASITVFEERVRDKKKPRTPSAWDTKQLQKHLRKQVAASGAGAGAGAGTAGSDGTADAREGAAAAAPLCPFKICPLTCSLTYFMTGDRRNQVPLRSHLRCLKAWAEINQWPDEYTTKAWSVQGYVDREGIKKDGTCDAGVVFVSGVPRAESAVLCRRVNAMLGSLDQQAAVFGKGLQLFEDGFIELKHTAVGKGLETFGKMSRVPLNAGCVAYATLLEDAVKFMACRGVAASVVGFDHLRDEPHVFVPVTVSVQGWAVCGFQVQGVVVGCRFGHV
jgi:hypothetical protein